MGNAEASAAVAGITTNGAEYQRINSQTPRRWGYI